VVVRKGLIEHTPLAAESVTVDRHQGDWEHVDVLLDPRTLQPTWLYMARHGWEGRFVRWQNAALSEGHPVIQAAYGGHPSYQPGCGEQKRERANRLLHLLRLDVLADWLVCGSERLAFRAATTPLVDLATVPWACWPGYFGQANFDGGGSAADAEVERDIHRAELASGPQAPLRQAENASVCSAGEKASERVMLPQLQRVAAAP
jgi:hypothetical protein